MTDYDSLGNAVVGLAGGDSISGSLGYEINGTWRVIDPDDAKKYLVRFSNGNFVSAFHRGRVPQTPDRPVLVGYDHIGRPVILGDDPTRIDSFLPSTNPGTGTTSYVRGSGNEFIIDPWMLKFLRVTVSSGTTLAVSAGWYYHEGVLVYFAGGTINLASVAATTSGFQNWVKVGINPATNLLVAVGGAQSFGSFEPDITLIEAIVFETVGYLLLAAVWTQAGDSLHNYQITDFRFTPGGEIGFPALDDVTDVTLTALLDEDILSYDLATGKWVNHPFDVFVDRVLTGGNGDVLSGGNGNVLLGGT